LKKISRESLEILKNKKGRSSENKMNMINHQGKNTDCQAKGSDQQCCGADLQHSIQEYNFRKMDPRIHEADLQTKHRSSKHCEIKKPSRYIPIETRRLVFQKAQGRCEFIGSDGKRCESHYQLEIDHKVAWSKGGSHDEANLSCLCKVHNTFRTKETHGFWWRDLDR
jgi:hypothetical protein